MYLPRESEQIFDAAEQRISHSISARLFCSSRHFCLGAVATLIIWECRKHTKKNEVLWCLKLTKYTVKDLVLYNWALLSWASSVKPSLWATKKKKIIRWTSAKQIQLIQKSLFHVGRCLKKTHSDTPDNSLQKSAGKGNVSVRSGGIRVLFL